MAQWWHKYRNIRYLPGHSQKLGLTRGLRFTKKTRIAVGGQICSCGCGQWVSEFHPAGIPRYSTQGAFYASKSCRPKLPRKPRPKSERLNKHGYPVILAPNHPRATGGYVFEHIVIWEQANGRILKSNERVHHINGDKADNRPDNLIALTISEHRKLHMRQQPPDTEQLRSAGRKGAASRWQNHVK